MPNKRKKNSSKGKVYLIGAGPGDPGLLTLRGASLLAQAEVVVYDRLVNPALLELAPHGEKIYAGKNIHGDSTTSLDQKRINALLVQKAAAGKRVVRLKGGDPFIFGRGGDEALFLKNKKIPFEVVPGVSAGSAVPAYAGIPVTDRSLASLVTFVTSHEDPSKKKQSAVNWQKLASIGGTLVCFMGLETLPRTVKLLLQGGKPAQTPVAVIERGTLPSQRVVEGTLSTIVRKVRRLRMEPPALTVIGDVARLRKKLAWFEKKPLAGKTVLVTRAAADAATLRQALEQQGARVLEYPAIKILPPLDSGPLDRALQNISQFDWIVFTSANGVEHVFHRLRALGKDVRIFSNIKIAAIGHATDETLQTRGLKADLVPEVFTSESLVEKLAGTKQVRGRKFLLPRTDIAPEFLTRRLQMLGGEVTEVVAYRTVAPSKEKEKLKNWIEKESIDFVTFSSSSTVRNFFEALPKNRRSRLKSRFVSIGPVTSQELKRFGYQPYREAHPHTVRGLIDVLTG